MPTIVEAIKQVYEYLNVIKKMTSFNNAVRQKVRRCIRKLETSLSKGLNIVEDYLYLLKESTDSTAFRQILDSSRPVLEAELKEAEVCEEIEQVGVALRQIFSDEKLALNMNEVSSLESKVKVLTERERVIIDSINDLWAQFRAKLANYESTGDRSEMDRLLDTSIELLRKNGAEIRILTREAIDII